MNKCLTIRNAPFDLFEDFFGGSPFNLAPLQVSGGAAGWTPQVDIRETADAIEVFAQLPGVDKKDISLRVKDGRLILSGEARRVGESNEGGWLRRESSFGSFYRAFDLPVDIVIDKVEAKHEDGVLKIRLPKSEAAKPLGIDIE